MTTELRPCPFCNGTNLDVDGRYLQYDPEVLATTVMCEDCEVVHHIEHWNTRPIEDDLRNRIAELEAEKECEMIVLKDGNAWCFVLPDFQNLQVSPAVWMDEGALDKIYKELRRVRNDTK